MARHEVVWTPIAENHLASIWLVSEDRAGVNVAVELLQKQIERDPLHAGEDRESSLQRVVIEPPIGILIEVIPDDYRVIVIGVFPFGD